MVLKFFALLIIVSTLIVSNICNNSANFILGRSKDLNQTKRNLSVMDDRISADNNSASFPQIHNNGNNTFLIQLKSRQLVPDVGINFSTIT